MRNFPLQTFFLLCGTSAKSPSPSCKQFFPRFCLWCFRGLTTQAPGANSYYIKLIIAIFEKQSIVLWFFFAH